MTDPFFVWTLLQPRLRLIFSLFSFRQTHIYRSIFGFRMLLWPSGGLPVQACWTRKMGWSQKCHHDSNWQEFPCQQEWCFSKTSPKIQFLSVTLLAHLGIVSVVFVHCNWYTCSCGNYTQVMKIFVKNFINWIGMISIDKVLS